MNKASFAGDPNTQTGEGTAPTIGTRITSQQRLTTPISQAAPWQQLTPQQQWFVAQNTGRWGEDAPYTASTPAVHIKRHDDGTVDCSPLMAQADVHIDLGGRGGRATAVTRPF